MGGAGVEFFFWTVLPSSVEPPVLCGVLADKFFYCSGIFCGDPFQGVVFVGPFAGEDNAIDTQFKEEAIADTSAVADCYRQITGDGEQSDAFVGAGLSAEEVDEQSFSAGVLVCDKAQCCAGCGGFCHKLGSAFFVDYFLAGQFADAVEVVIDELVIQRTGDAVDIETEQRHQVTHDFEVAVMTCNH